MNTEMETRSNITFKLPPPGEGAACDYRDAGKELGAEYAKCWIAIHSAAAAKGFLTPARADEFQRRAVADMVGTAGVLRARGYAAARIAQFENAMRSGYKDALSRFREYTQAKNS